MEKKTVEAGNHVPSGKTASVPPCLQAALDYAARGWLVIPLHYPILIKGDKTICSCGKEDCGSIGKHPLTVHGLKDATKNILIIRGWWAKWPLANVGIITGKSSGLVVLDIDEKNQGFESLKQLEKKGNLPSTPTVDTGGGGRHYFMAHNGKPVRNRAGLAGYSGIDLRGDGGYVVAPPSKHASGYRYTWRVAHIGRKVAEIPEWFQAVLEGEQRKSAGVQSGALPLTEWNRMWAGVVTGQRNDTAARLAGRLLARVCPTKRSW